MRKIWKTSLIFVLILSTLLVGCSADDPLTEDVFSNAGVHANTGFFTALFVDGVPITGGSGASVFTDLTDVPSDYTGLGGQYVRVKSAEDGLETATLSGGGDMTKAVYDPDEDDDIAEAQLQLNYATHSNALDHSNSLDHSNELDHSHANKTTLDNIQEALTTALKTSYDWLVTNITEAWKGIVDGHIASTANPHSVTAAQTGAAPSAEGVTNGNTHDHNGGDGGTISYNNLSDKPSIPTQYTDELAQDATGGMIADTATVNMTYTDATPELKADVVTQMSVTSDANGVKLSGDSAAPGNNQYYGTNGGGTKGYYALPAGGGSWTTSVVTTDQVVTNSAVLADATGLSFTTVANTQYTIRLRVFFATTSATADFKYRITHAGTTTRVWRRILSGEGDNLPTFKAPVNAFDSADRTLLDTAVATNNIIEEDIILQVGASGGVLKLQFAQNTATAGQSATVFEGSYIEYAAS